MRMTGNTVLVTGATSGIGLAFAERFAELGNRVLICGRRKDRLETIVQRIPQIAYQVCDVTDDEERIELARWVLDHHPEVNVLINNAGVQLALDLTREADLLHVRREIETNFVAPLHLTSLLCGHLRSKERAAIVNISSGLAFVPIAFMPVYCATKAAIHSLTLSLRHQLKDTPVTVFEIAPPSVDTELGHERRTDKSQSHGGMPVGELIAAAIAALEGDVIEAAIGPAAGMREAREKLFDRINH
jgi:uncharacterized oxidoreductase